MKRREDIITLRARLLRVIRETKDEAEEWEYKYFLGLVDALNWVLGEKETGAEDFLPTPHIDIDN